MSRQHPTKQTIQGSLGNLEAGGEGPTEQDSTADAILSVVTALNALEQNEFCTARTILYDGEMSDSTKLAALEDIGSNGVALVNALNGGYSVLSNCTTFMDLNSNGGNYSFTDNVIDLMLYDRDVVWNNAPKKPDCTAYNAQVKSIGNAWILATSACAREANLVCIAVACVIALDALAANDAAYPDCANGGNQQGLPLHWWWYIPFEAQEIVCE